jgi:hypothetical protein
MKKIPIILLQNENVVSDGYFYIIRFHPLKFLGILIIIALLIYFIRKRRSR